MNEPPIGMIGIGLLGSALAGRLRDAGFRVVGLDLDRDRLDAFARMGGEPVATAEAVVRTCDRIVFSLPTSAVAVAVVDRIEGSLRPGQIIVDTTTGEPADAETIGARLRGRGVAYLDATVSGSSEQARRGEATIMAGGETRDFESCADLFDVFAASTFHVGPIGSGARMKLATNLVLGLNRAALAEGLAFARAIGLDPGRTLDVLRSGAGYSRIMDAKGPKMVAGEFSPQARLSQHLKDVRLILDEAVRAGLATPLSEAHRLLLEVAEAAGWGGLDNSAILRAYERPGTSDSAYS